MGYNACLNDSECNHILLKVESKTVYNTVLELGRAKLKLSQLRTNSQGSFDSERCNIWVDVYHKRTGKIVAKLELNAYKIVCS
jgi:hypothetical protein